MRKFVVAVDDVVAVPFLDREGLSGMDDGKQVALGKGGNHLVVFADHDLCAARVLFVARERERADLSDLVAVPGWISENRIPVLSSIRTFGGNEARRAACWSHCTRCRTAAARTTWDGARGAALRPGCR